MTMPITLLSTKLYAPRPQSDLVSRPHLTAKLLQGVRRPHSFILLSGPAGSGKTTLLSQFIREVGRPVAWLSLDDADDDPVRFWTYVLAACRAALPGVGDSALDLLRAPQPLPDVTIPTLLINDLAAREQPLVLILDDCHLIDSLAIHNGVSFLLEHLPHNVHVVISTRVDPPWPLGRYRVRNQMVEIRAGALRFSRDEAAQLLNHTMGLELSADEVATLDARTEGWAAGLQLAALALQGLALQGPAVQAPPLPDAAPEHGDAATFVQAFAGSHLYVAEYLVEEVLKRQPEHVQHFLLQTAILERLHAALCDAVTGRHDAREMLVDLHRANLFVIPLDDVGQWFRYHHLFADLLRARLSQTLPADAVAALHTRAADWYERNGLTAEAIRHAVAANDFEKAASLVEEQASAMMFSGRAAALGKWLQALPAASFRAHPRLEIYRLWIELMQGKADLSDRAVQEKEEMLKALPPSPQNDRLRLELTVVLCRFVAFTGNTSRAIGLAKEALVRLSEDEMALRARAHSALAIAYLMEGRRQEAAQAHERAIHLARAAGNDSLAAHAMMMRAMEETDYGQLHAAAVTYQAIIEMDARSGKKPFYPAGLGHIGLAGIHLEWNDLDVAEAHLQRGIALCRQGGLAGLHTAQAHTARLRQARGDLHGALKEIRLLERTSGSVNPLGTAREIVLAAAVGDLEAAARVAGPWLEAVNAEPSAARPPLLLGEIMRLTLARLFLARGEVARALQLCDEVEVTAAPAQRNGRLVELYLLRALAYRQQGRGAVLADAVDALGRALALAEPEGYTLLFLEAGAGVVPLLLALVARRDAPSPVRRLAQNLLNAFPESQRPAAPGAAAGLVEPLTPREMEVLQLIAAGHSNKVIAGELFITVRTVKKHAGNIYGKLNVRSRTQAVARARELGLLSTQG